MKKKLLTITSMLLLFFALASCDILSTILAAKGFYDEYQTYTPIYNEATYYTILTETDLTISDTDVEGLDEIHARVYLELDQESTFMYVEQTIGEESKASMYEDGTDIYVEYIIDGTVVTPSLPEGGERFDGSTNANILNDNFTYESVENENKTGNHTYEFDVYLNQAINLEALGNFVDQLEIFGGDTTSFDDAVAHVVCTFESTDSVIDVTASVTDYTITFEDQTYVTLSLVNHTQLSIPEDFAMRDIFSDAYQMVAVDNILLARRPYAGDEVIVYPAVAGESGWAKLELGEGIYELQSAHFASMTLSLFHDDETAVTVNEDWQFELTESETLYLYIQPGADFDMDIVVAIIGGAALTSTEATTTLITTQTAATNTTTVPIDTTASASTTAPSE